MSRASTAIPAERLSGNGTAASDAPVPRDVEAEEAVLGAVLMDVDAIDRIMPVLSAEDFWQEAHRLVYQAAVVVAKQGQPVDLITLNHELVRSGIAEAVGGIGFLSHLATAVPTASYVDHYAELVQRTALLRRLILAGGQIAGLGYQSKHDAASLRGEVDRLLATVWTKSRDEAGVLGHDAAAKGFLDLLIAAKEAEAKAPLVTFGWRQVDEIARIRPGTVTVIGAKSGHGKTLVCERLLERAALAGRSWAYCHYELTNEQMQFRRAARWTGIAYSSWERGLPSGDPVDRYLQWQSDWPGKPWLIYCAGWTLSRLVSQLRRLAAVGTLDGIIVDYIQMVPTEGVGEKDMNHAQRVGEIVKQLKNLGGTLPGQPPIVLASQMNREVTSWAELLKGKMRDSGEIEEKANQVVLLWNEFAENPKTTHGTKILVKVDKNTLGINATDVELENLPGRFRFIDPGNDEERKTV